MAYVVKIDDTEFKVELEKKGNTYDVLVDGQRKHVELMHRNKDILLFVIDGRPYRIVLEADDQLLVNDEVYRAEVIDEQIQKLIKASPQSMHNKELVLKASMPGLVIDVLVDTGDSVTRDQGLVIIEAMKMQNEMKSSRDGVVKQVLVKKGQTINSGDKLLVIE
jgi:biotin carboxyl carrier protein